MFKFMGLNIFDLHFVGAYLKKVEQVSEKYFVSHLGQGRDLFSFDSNQNSIGFWLIQIQFVLLFIGFED